MRGHLDKLIEATGGGGGERDERGKLGGPLAKAPPAFEGSRRRRMGCMGLVEEKESKGRKKRERTTSLMLCAAMLRCISLYASTSVTPPIIVLCSTLIYCYYAVMMGGEITRHFSWIRM